MKSIPATTNSFRKSSRILAGSIAALVTAGFLAAPAPARAVGLWNGNADGLWSGLNWDVAPTALDPLVFDDLNLTLTGALVTATTNDAFLTNVAGITFNGVSYSIGGSAFTLEGVVNTTGAATISANVTLGAGGGTLVTNAASSLNFTGTFDAGSQALDASGAGNVTFANAISNGTNLAKSGAGTLTLAGTNGFTDLITSGGIITGGVITLNSGATAVTNNANSAVNSNITLTTAPGTITSNAGTLTLGGTLNAGSMALDLVGFGNVTLANAITNGTTLTKSGFGTVTLAGTNAFLDLITSGGIITGGTITLGAGATALTSNSTSAVNSNVTFVTTPGTITSNAGTLTLGGTLDAGSLALTFAGAGNATVSNAIANGTTLTKNDGGTLTLTGANNYTGATLVSGGILIVNNATALGTTAGGTTVSAGASLQLTATSGSIGAEALILNGTGVSNDGALRSLGGDKNFAGSITLASSSRINSDNNTWTLTHASGITGVNTDLTMGVTAGTSNVTGAVSLGSGNFTKDGAGTWNLNGANNWTGTTTVNAGTLTLGVGTVSVASTIAINGVSTVLQLSGTQVQGINFASNITGTGGLKSGGTMILRGVNSYSGGTTVALSNDQGISFDNDGSLGAGLITFNSSTSYLASVDATAHTLANNVLFSNASSSTGNRFGTWGSSNRGIGNLTLSGPISIVGATPIIGVDGATTTTFSGLVSSTGAFGINKNGTGTLILSNAANSYSGTTTVAAGVLRLDDAGALPGGIGAVGGTSALIFNGGVLGLNIATDFNRASGTGVDQVSWTASALGGFAAQGANRVVNLGGASATQTWNTAGPFGGSGLILGNATAFVVDFQNPIDLNGAVRTVQVDGTTTVNAKLSGILSGTGGLNKTGSGALLVSADNTYSGATTIAQGLLKLGATGGATNTPLGTIAGSTTVNANGAALDVNGFTLGTAEPLTLNGTGLSGGGALTNSGAAATYSGPITLASAAYVGSSSGKLTVTGGVSGAFGLTFAGSGDTTISTTPINANVTLITKLGSPSGAGNLTIDVASTLMMAPISVNAGTFTLSGNGQLGDVAGTVTYTAMNAGRTDGQTFTAPAPAGFNVGSFVMGQMVYNLSGTNTNTSGNPVGFAVGAQTFHSGVMALPGGAIAVDNSGTNLNYRFGGNAGTVGRAIGLGGATLTFTPSAAGAVAENLSGLVFMQGHSVVTLNADAGFQTDIKAAILNRVGTTTETALIRGSSLGTAAGAGISTLTFTAAPTFIGQTGAAGTTNKGILPYVIVDSSATGFGTSFATTSGAGQIVRPLNTGTEMVTDVYTANTNVRLTGAQPAIAADTSINSLTITSGNVTVTDPAFPTARRTLTLSSGGLLSTTAASTISGGILAGGTPFNVFTPGANAAANVLTISSRVNVSGLVKAGGGTLLLSSVSPAFPGYSQNSFGGYGNHAGNIFLNEGTTKLGAHNALGNTGFATSGQNDGNSMTLNPGAILDLNGKTQFIGALSSGFSGDNSPTGPLGLGGGNITGTGGAITLTTGNPGGGPTSFVYAGSVTGSVGFAIVGGGQREDLTGANSSSGPILIMPAAATNLRDYGTMSGFSELSINNGNGLLIDNNQLANINNRLNASGTLRLNSGKLDYRGRAQTLSTDAVGTVSADTGTSTINIQAGGTNVNSAELTIGTLTRASGATLNFSGGTFGQTGTSGQVRAFITNALTGNVALIGAVNNQVIPGVTIGGDLASYNSVTGLSTLSYTGGTLNTLGAVSTANYNGSGAVLAGGQTINALKPNGAITFVNNGDILTLTSGMIVSANQTYGTTSVRGGLTSATSELILEANTGNLTLNSVVSGANKLVLARGGTYTLTANNLHTGGTTVDGGTLALTNNGLTTPLVVGIPAATVPANGLVLSGATVTLSNSAGQINAANIVTLNGGSTLNLMGNNTLAGLVLNNISSTVPVVNTTPSAFGATTNSTDITLTLTGGITSTSNNIASSAGATINGRVSLPSSATINVGAGTFNGLVLNPWSSDLTIKGLTGGGGTITKSGAGTLRLDVPTVITGTLDVTGGGLLVGAAGAGARFANVVLEDGTNLNLNGFAGTFGSLATGGTGTSFVTNTGAAATLTVGFSNANTTFAGSFQRRDDSTFNLINLATVGTGTTTLTGNTSTASGTITLNSTSGGGVKFLDNGVNNFVQGAITANAGATLTLDNTGAANLSNRLGNAGVTLSGGNFVFLGANAVASPETTTGALTLNTGESTITSTPGTGGGTNTLTFANLTQGAGGTGLFLGTGLGTASNRILAGTSLTNNIIPRYAVGTDWATYNQDGTGAANANGIQAISSGAYTIPVDINTVTASNNVKVDATVATRNLTAARSVNSLNFTDNSVTLGTNGALLPTAGLTLNAGAVMVNGTAATISTPVLTLSVEGIFRVNSGKDLTVNSRIGGNLALTKTGSGDMTLGRLADYIGTTTVNQGTLKFGTGIGSNPLQVSVTTGAPTVQTLQMNGGTLDLNGNKLLVGTINSASNFTGGTITNTAGGSAVTLTSLSGSSTFGGKITGNLNFTYIGGTTTLKDTQSYSGATIIRNGQLVLQDKGALYDGVGDLTNASVSLQYATLVFDHTGLNTTAAGPTRIPSTVPIRLDGGYLAVKPGASMDTVTTLGTVTVGGYLNNISSNFTLNQTGTTLSNTLGGTNTLTIGNVATAGIGGVLNLGVYSNGSGALTNSQAQRLFFTQVGGNTVTSGSGWSTGATGMLPAWITLGNGVGGSGSANKSGFENFATLSSTGFGIVTYGDTTLGAPAYLTGTTAGVNFSTGSVTTIGAGTMNAGNYLTGALKLTGNLAFTGNTDTLNLESGGLTAGGVAASNNIGGAANNGQLTAGGLTPATPVVDLYIYNSGTLNSKVIDNANGATAKVRLIIANINNATAITGNNTHTGGTVLIDGREGQFGATLGGTGVIIPAGGLTLVSNFSGGAKGLTTTAAGQIDATNDVTLAGSNVFLTMVGTNTLASLIFDIRGNSGTPTVNTATKLTLSKTTAQGSAITSINDNIAGGIPTVAGTELQLQDGATITTSGEAPVSLSITAPLTFTGATAALKKAGAGSVSFTNQNTFLNNFDLNGGTVIFTAASVGGGTGGAQPTTSQIGRGTLTMADGTAIMGSSALSIGNVIATANGATFTFGTLDATNARATATNSLTLTNTVTLGTGAQGINVNGLNMTGTISGQLTGGGTGFTKSGPGTLILNNATNNFGGTITISGGTLQHNLAGSIPTGRIMTVASGAAFNINAISQSIDSLNGAGSVINPGAAAVLTINGTTNGSFSGVLAATTAANLSVVKNGVNSQILSGANVYGGATTVTAGTLVAANATALGTIAAGTTVASGASLDVQANIGTEAIGVQGTGDGGNGALVTGSGTGTVGGTVTLAANTSIGGAGTLNINGVVAAAAFTVDKVGAGTTNFGTASTLTSMGTLNATAGTTNVNSVLGTGTSAVAVTGATFLKFGSVSQTLASLSIDAGSTVTFSSGLASFTGEVGNKAPSFGGGSAVVPEPGTIGLLLVGALGILNRRRRVG